MLYGLFSGFAGIAQLVEHDLTKVGVAEESRFPGSKMFADDVPMLRNSSVGRARPCQGQGSQFESRFPLPIIKHSLKDNPCCGNKARDW